MQSDYCCECRIRIFAVISTWLEIPYKTTTSYGKLDKINHIIILIMSMFERGSFAPPENVVWFGYGLRSSPNILVLPVLGHYKSLSQGQSTLTAEVGTVNSEIFA